MKKGLNIIITLPSVLDTEDEQIRVRCCQYLDQAGYRDIQVSGAVVSAQRGTFWGTHLGTDPLTGYHKITITPSEIVFKIPNYYAHFGKADELVYHEEAKTLGIFVLGGYMDQSKLIQAQAERKKSDRRFIRLILLCIIILIAVIVVGTSLYHYFETQ